ncbi:MAG: saccharopine dehydrogenase family protein [Rhodobiaceae bacterium]|nr:saccharopine dehydrogenase family protein [Rhodobiaceae bacterium]MCC0056027.1 saccharopine dehydrogenase family protein [Rhodobiaceae bacterium]
MIIGAGGVGHVVAHKCARHNDELGDIHIVSRTGEKCREIVQSIRDKHAMKRPGVIEAHELDVMDETALAGLIARTGTRIVINVGSTFVNMSVLSACIATGAAYIDTAIHEDPLRNDEPPPWYANYEWKRKTECRQAGVTAILGAGFDPGVVNAYAALADLEYFDRMESIDIIDVNAGDHGEYFATNFDPEINFREFTTDVWSWQAGEWTRNRMFEIRKDWDLPIVGKRATYLTGHDEIHSLQHFLDVPDIRFWMGFGERYINVFNVLNNIGLLSEQPVVTAEGEEIVPLKVVKAALPDPASLAPNYEGKTCIGDLVRGIRNGEKHEIFIYNICDHQEAFDEVGSQAISYTAGVPAAAAARLIANGRWDVRRMANIEELPPRPFLKALDEMGLPTRLRDGQRDVRLSFEDDKPGRSASSQHSARTNR